MEEVNINMLLAAAIVQYDGELLIEGSVLEQYDFDGKIIAIRVNQETRTLAVTLVDAEGVEDA